MTNIQFYFVSSKLEPYWEGSVTEQKDPYKTRNVGQTGGVLGVVSGVVTRDVNKNVEKTLKRAKEQSSRVDGPSERATSTGPFATVLETETEGAVLGLVVVVVT